MHVTLGQWEFGNRVFGQRGTQTDALSGMGFNSFLPVRVYIERGHIFIDATLYGGHPNYPPIVITHNDLARHALMDPPGTDADRIARRIPSRYRPWCASTMRE